MRIYLCLLFRILQPGERRRTRCFVYSLSTPDGERVIFVSATDFIFMLMKLKTLKFIHTRNLFGLCECVGRLILSILIPPLAHSHSLSPILFVPDEETHIHSISFHRCCRKVCRKDTNISPTTLIKRQGL